MTYLVRLVNSEYHTGFFPKVFLAKIESLRKGAYMQNIEVFNVAYVIRILTWRQPTASKLVQKDHIAEIIRICKILVTKEQIFT